MACYTTLTQERGCINNIIVSFASNLNVDFINFCILKQEFVYQLCCAYNYYTILRKCLRNGKLSHII